MNIMATNLSFEAKLPKPKKVKKPDFFRDRELFNSKRDKIDGKYYDIDDIAVHHNSFGPAYDVNSAEADGFFNKLA